MATAEQHFSPAPFDAAASRYDETFSSSLIGRAQRGAVWNELAKTFRTGDRVLEIGCGTGIDACFLAKHGVRVVACDASSRMIEMTTSRIDESNLRNFVCPRVLRAEDLASFPFDAPFDGVFSNFGVLNCVEDLGQIASGPAQLLKPGAKVLLCWMPPHCAWETIWYLAHGSRDKAFRRLNREGVDARISDGASLRVYYPSVRSLTRAFAPEFRVQSIKGIGIAVPPSYLEPWARRHPRLFGLCKQFDSWMARCPGIRVLGDHVLVQLERSATTSGSA